MRKLLLVTMLIMSIGAHSQDIRAKRSQTSNVRGKTVIEDTRRNTTTNSSYRKTSYVYKDAQGNTFQVYQYKGTGKYFIMVKHPRHGWLKRTIKF